MRQSGKHRDKERTMARVGRQSEGTKDREVRGNIIGKEKRKRRSLKEKEVRGDFRVLENLANLTLKTCFAVCCTANKNMF